MIEDMLTQYSHNKQLANAYRALMTERLKTCHSLEQRMQQHLKLNPLTKRDKDKLIALIETGEMTYAGADDSEPF